MGSKNKYSVRVLLAEDDRSMRTFLADTLRRDGYSVLEAETGSELLELIGTLLLEPDDQNCFAAIVSDLRLPECSGMVALTALRDANLDTPFILITALGSEQVHSEARGLNAVILDKPFSMEAFRKAVLGATLGREMYGT